MASSSKGSSFLSFHGKKYDLTFDRLDEDGLLQDPRTHAPYCHVDTKVSFFFGFLAWKKCCCMFHWKFHGETLSFCCCNFGALHDWLC